MSDFDANMKIRSLESKLETIEKELDVLKKFKESINKYFRDNLLKVAVMVILSLAGGLWKVSTYFSDTQRHNSELFAKVSKDNTESLNKLRLEIKKDLQVIQFEVVNLYKKDK